MDLSPWTVTSPFSRLTGLIRIMLIYALQFLPDLPRPLKFIVERICIPALDKRLKPFYRGLIFFKHLNNILPVHQTYIPPHLRVARRNPREISESTRRIRDDPLFRFFQVKEGVHKGIGRSEERR